MKYSVYLSEEQRSQLEGMIRSGHDSARVLARARILLLTDRNTGDRHEDAEVAQAVMVCIGTVRRIRKEFALRGLESALYEKPRPGAIPKITGDVEAKLVTLACSTPPDDRDSWTCQLLADKLVELNLVESISAVAVHYRLKKTNSSPGKYSHGA